MDRAHPSCPWDTQLAGPALRRGVGLAERETLARQLQDNRQKNEDRHHLNQMHAWVMDINYRRAKFSKYDKLNS